MAYEAMARRYRPRTFDDVIGQEHVAQTLKNAITAERVAHAYLFCGPHGCGKTSMARIFACALVCENGPTNQPCGVCSLCQDVLRGQDVDVQEIDGASNNGVEQVRALRDQAGYIPQRARFKIYIIDEVHMLSTAAFNALLKTLEEPPPHVKFILATTDPHKVLETVHSRCQRFDFRLVPPPRLAAFFKKLAEQEQAEIEEDALDAVAAFSGGSVRDGLVLLDQLLSYAQGTVTREDVERVRGVAGIESILGLYEAIFCHDPVKALAHVDTVAQCGTNVGDYLDQLIDFGRDLMHVVVTGDLDGVSAYGPARTTLEQMSNEATLDMVLLILDVFAQARTRVRQRALSNPLVPLEMAVARLAGLDNVIPVSAAIQKLDALAKGAPLPEPGTHHAPVQPAPVATAQPPQTPAPPQAQVQPAQPVAAPVPPTPVVQDPQPSAPAPAAPTQASDASPTAPTEADASTPVTESAATAPQHLPWEAAPKAAAQAEAPPPAPNPAQVEASTPVAEAPAAQPPQAQPIPQAGDRASLQKAWQAICANLAESNKADMAFLHDVWLDAIEQDALILSVPGGGSFIFEQLEDTKRKQRIADAAEPILGRALTIRLVMREAGEIEESPQHGDEDGQRGLSPQARARREAERDPAVRLIIDSFEGNISNIE